MLGEMDTRGRYCRWHEAPEVRRVKRLRLPHWMRSRDREGRKRIVPGVPNTALGAGWEEAKRR